MRIVFRKKYLRPPNASLPNLADSKGVPVKEKKTTTLPECTDEDLHSGSDIHPLMIDPLAGPLFRLNNQFEEMDGHCARLCGSNHSSSCSTPEHTGDFVYPDDTISLSQNFSDLLSECENPLLDFPTSSTRIEREIQSEPVIRFNPGLDELKDTVMEGPEIHENESLNNLPQKNVKSNAKDCTSSDKAGKPSGDKGKSSLVTPGSLYRKTRTVPGSQDATRNGSRLTGSLGSVNIDILREARKDVDEAIKNQKIFSVVGPYHRIRMALRARGWVEKFFRSVSAGRSRSDQVSGNTTARLRSTASLDRNPITSDPMGMTENDDDEDDDDDYSSDNPSGSAAGTDESKILPWHEKDGYYGLLSRLLRSTLPNFVWSLRKSQVDFRFLRRDQIVNHHCRAPFTTKIGLCRQLHQVWWFAGVHSDDFFPRCYLLNEEDDRQTFIDEFRLTACMALLKLMCLAHNRDVKGPAPAGVSTMSRPATAATIPQAPPSTTESPLLQPEFPQDGIAAMDPGVTGRVFYVPPCCSKDQSEKLPPAVLDMAIARCQHFLRNKFHLDFDKPPLDLTEKNWPWENFLPWYSLVCKYPEMLEDLKEYAEVCHRICIQLRQNCLQFDMDGTMNVWIVKPGAKSRGRGIICYNQLEDLLRIMPGQTGYGECKFVVQKYIERPLLLHKTKFDIRQWFLVTDWAPLTVWWYRDCYLRFCSREFTLDDFSEAVHLSNNAIQHKYRNGPRSSDLPDENMWTIQEFQTWLKAQGQGNIWEERIEPAMKRAIVQSLLSTQDVVEVRKNCFALYGADFLLTEDFKLWLIEVNASPCMSTSTSVTSKLTTNVLEDVLKVVLDRRVDRNCDVGQFELIYRQSMMAPLVYTGLDLRVEGTQLVPPPVEVRGIAKFPTLDVPPNKTSGSGVACKNANGPPIAGTKRSSPPLTAQPETIGKLSGVEIFPVQKTKSITRPDSNFKLVQKQNSTSHTNGKSPPMGLDQSGASPTLRYLPINPVFSQASANAENEAVELSNNLKVNNFPSSSLDSTQPDNQLYDATTHPAAPTMNSKRPLFQSRQKKIQPRCSVVNHRSSRQTYDIQTIDVIGTVGKDMPYRKLHKQQQQQNIRFQTAESNALNRPVPSLSNQDYGPNSHIGEIPSDVFQCLATPPKGVDPSLSSTSSQSAIFLRQTGDTPQTVEVNGTTRCVSAWSQPTGNPHRLMPVSEQSKSGRKISLFKLRGDRDPSKRRGKHILVSSLAAFNKGTYKPSKKGLVERRDDRGLPNVEQVHNTVHRGTLKRNVKPNGALHLAVNAVQQRSTKLHMIPSRLVTTGLITDARKPVKLKSIKRSKPKSQYEAVQTLRGKRSGSMKQTQVSPTPASDMNCIDDANLLGMAHRIFQEASQTAAIHTVQFVPVSNRDSNDTNLLNRLSSAALPEATTGSIGVRTSSVTSPEVHAPLKVRERLPFVRGRFLPNDLAQMQKPYSRDQDSFNLNLSSSTTELESDDSQQVDRKHAPVMVKSKLTSGLTYGPVNLRFLARHTPGLSV